MTALGIALGGINAATDRFERTAARVARAATGLAGSDEDLARDMVDQSAERSALTANVAVARTADEMAGTLLHIIA